MPKYVIGFFRDKPDGLTDIDNVIEVTGLTKEEIESCMEVISLPLKYDLMEVNREINELDREIQEEIFENKNYQDSIKGKDNVQKMNQLLRIRDLIYSFME